MQITLVWKRPYSSGTVLFFLNRYLPVIDTFLTIDCEYSQVLLRGIHLTVYPVVWTIRPDPEVSTPLFSRFFILILVSTEMPRACFSHHLCVILDHHVPSPTGIYSFPESSLCSGHRLRPKCVPITIPFHPDPYPFSLTSLRSLVCLSTQPS